MDFNCLVNDSYENLLEYQNILHDLDMKMIKCEHVCLINEDTNTLLLAEEEYMSKLKATLKTIWNKIIEKLEEFIILMRKMINKFRNTFLLSKEFKASFDSVINNQTSINSLNDIVFKKNKTNNSDDEKIQFKSLEKNNIDYADAFKILRDPKLFDYNLKMSFSRILDLNKFDEATARKTLENFSKFKNSSDDIRYSTLTKDEIVNAYSVLVKYGPEWIKLFEKVRNEAKKQSNVVFNANPDKNATLQASIFQRMINKGIMYIQSIMTACFKVCYAIKNVRTSKIDMYKEKEKLTTELKTLQQEQNPDRNKVTKLLVRIIKLKELSEKNKNLNEDFYEEISLDDLAKIAVGLLKVNKENIRILKEILYNDSNFNRKLEDIERYKNNINKYIEGNCYETAMIVSMTLFNAKIPHRISFGSPMQSRTLPILKSSIIHGWVKDIDGNLYESNLSKPARNGLNKNNMVRLSIVSAKIDNTITREEYRKIIERDIFAKL